MLLMMLCVCFLTWPRSQAVPSEDLQPDDARSRDLLLSTRPHSSEMFSPYLSLQEHLAFQREADVAKGLPRCSRLMRTHGSGFLSRKMGPSPSVPRTSRWLDLSQGSMVVCGTQNISWICTYMICCL